MMQARARCSCCRDKHQDKYWQLDVRAERMQSSHRLPAAAVEGLCPTACLLRAEAAEAGLAGAAGKKRVLL